MIVLLLGLFYLLDACFPWFFDFLNKFPPQSRLPREIELSARCRDNISLRLLQQSGLAFFTDFLTSQPNYYPFYSVFDVEEERNWMFYLIRCLCKEITQLKQWKDSTIHSLVTSYRGCYKIPTNGFFIGVTANLFVYKRTCTLYINISIIPTEWVDI